MSNIPPEDERSPWMDGPGSELPDRAGNQTRRTDPTRAVPPTGQPAPRPAQRPAPPGPRQPGQQAGAPRSRPQAPPPPGYSAAPPPSPVQRGTGRRPTRADSGWYLPWWSLVILIGVVGVIAFALLLAVSELSQPYALGNQTPRIEVITSQPTLSQDFIAPSAPVVAPPPDMGANPAVIPPAVITPTVPLPTPIPSPSLPPGDFVIGARVRVVGVEASGLNVRATPGYTGIPRFLAYDGSVFVLVDGPQTADGLEWWRIEDPDDPNRFGWAARNFLMVTSS